MHSHCDDDAAKRVAMTLIRHVARVGRRGSIANRIARCLTPFALLMGSSHTKLRWCVWAGVSRQTGCVRLHALRDRRRLSTHAFLSAVPSAIVTRWPALIEAHSSHMRTTGVRSTRCGDLVRPSAPRVNTPVVP